MKKYLKEILIFLLQLLVFYIYPIFVLPTDQPMGVLLWLLLLTSILSLIIGAISEEKLKYFYPAISVIIFLPTIFIYYNSSALIYLVFMFVGSVIGLFIGMLVRWIIKK